MIIGEVPDRINALGEIYRTVAGTVHEPRKAADDCPLLGDVGKEAKGSCGAGGLTPRADADAGPLVYDISVDARALAVEWAPQGVRYKDFKKAVNDSSERSVDDAELRGGQTALCMLKNMVQMGVTRKAGSSSSLGRISSSQNTAPGMNYRVLPLPSTSPERMAPEASARLRVSKPLPDYWRPSLRRTEHGRGRCPSGRARDTSSSSPTRSASCRASCEGTWLAQRARR